MNWLRNSLSWKLLISYLVVILVVVITLTVAAESVIPTAFDRHMMGMQQMMGTQMGMSNMADDLFNGFRRAFNEAMLRSVIVATASAIVVSIFVSRRVVTPIRQMMQASQHIADGYYHERVQVLSGDELGQLAQTFNQMAASLEQTEAMRRELIGNVAHELRTPLTTIKGYMEGLIDGVLPADAETYQHVYREADRLQRLVRDLQELSRVEANSFDLNRAQIQLGDLIRQTSIRLSPQFEEKGVDLTVEIEPDLPVVYADEDRVSQVLLNLMGNALQYTPAGGVVSISAQRYDGTVRVCIKDTGIGITAEHLPHLFDRFYRVDKSRSRAGGGSGIGLTISRHLVEAHRGRIWAASDGPGQGSTFSFALPVIRPDDKNSSGRHS
jgi:histidine kinase